MLLEARPQTLLCAVRIIIEALAEAFAFSVQLLNKLADDCIGRRRNIVRAECIPRLLHDVICQFERYLVRDGQRTDRHAGMLRNVFDQRRIHTL